MLSPDHKKVTDGCELGLSDAGNIEQVFNRFEKPVDLPMGNDPLGKDRTDTGELLKLGAVCPVERNQTVAARTTSLPHLGIRPGNFDLVTCADGAGQVYRIKTGSYQGASGGRDGIHDKGTLRNLDHPGSQNPPTDMDDDSRCGRRGWPGSRCGYRVGWRHRDLAKDDTDRDARQRQAQRHSPSEIHSSPRFLASPASFSLPRAETQRNPSD